MQLSAGQKNTLFCQIIMTARPTLVVASGNAATIWDYQLGEEGVVNTFYPHGEHNIADICWNHNGQGMFGCVSTTHITLVFLDTVLLTCFHDILSSHLHSVF